MLSKFISLFKTTLTLDEEKFLNILNTINVDDTNLPLLNRHHRIIYNEKNRRIIYNTNSTRLYFECKDDSKVINKFAKNFSLCVTYAPEYMKRLDNQIINNIIEQKIIDSGSVIMYLPSNYLIVKTKSGNKYSLNFRGWCSGENHKFEIADPNIVMPLIYNEDVWDSVYKQLLYLGFSRMLYDLKNFVLKKVEDEFELLNTGLIRTRNLA